MKIAATLLGLLVLLAILPLFFRQAPETPRPQEQGLPWQVAIHDDGTSSVFGIRLEQAGLETIRSLHGDNLEVAILEPRGEPASLEAYYGRFAAGFISGKLVVKLGVDQETLETLRGQSGRPVINETGNLKYPLSPDLPLLIRQARIDSLTFIPTANLDRETIEQRFGTAEEMMPEGESSRHLLYPHQGMDLIWNQEGKEVFQYVAPRSFDLLRKQLARQPETDPH